MSREIHPNVHPSVCPPTWAARLPGHSSYSGAPGPSVPPDCSQLFLSQFWKQTEGPDFKRIESGQVVSFQAEVNFPIAGAKEEEHSIY